MLQKKLNLSTERWVGRITLLRKVIGDAFRLFLHFRAGRKWRAWVSKSQIYKWQLLTFLNNRLVPNRKRSTSRLYVVTLLI